MDAPSCSCLPIAADAGKACQKESSSSLLVVTATATAATTTTAKAPALTPEIKQQKHPLLRRHFFTIGIGDCFVQPPAHPLPSVYLSSSTTSSSRSSSAENNDTVGGGDDVLRVVHNNNNFESTELVAAIKSTPQDFVVREIALPHRIISGLNEQQVESMRIASLEGLPNCSSSSNSSTSNDLDQSTTVIKRCKESSQAIIMGQGKILMTSDSAVVEGEGNGNNDAGQSLSFESTAVDEKLGKKNVREASRQHDVVKVTNNDKMQQQQLEASTVQQAAASQSEEDDKPRASASSSLDPMSTLQKFLPARSHVDESSTTTTTTTPKSSSLNDLARLQADAVDWIQERASSSNQATHYDDTDTDHIASSRSVVIRPLLAPDTRVERGEFHTALRLAFPLLKVASTETKSSYASTSSNSNNSTGIPTSSDYEVKVTVDDSFFGLVPYLYEPHVDIPRLYQFLRNRRHDSDSDDQQVFSQPRQSRQSNTLNGNNQSRLLYLRLRPDLDRSERRPVHHIIDSKSGRSLSTETLPTYHLHPDDKDCTLVTAAIVVSWSKTAQRRACKNENKKRKRGPPMTNDNDDNNANVNSSDVDPNPNLLFILKKTQIEHLAAIQLLSKALHCRQPDIGLSGIKDMQAVTYQFCTIRNHPTNHIRQQARDFLQSRGVEISQNLYKVDWLLQKGRLQGNRFEIVLRNVRRIRVSQPTTTAAAATEESFFPCDADYIQEAVKRIETYGILNFYGEQRVGTAGEEALVGTRALDIGRAMLQQDYAKAIDLIMTGRLLCKGGTEHERDEVRLVRQTWKESGGDPFVTWKVLPPSESSLLLRERLVLRGLKRYGTTEPLAALKCLQYNDRVFWIQAYQSYIFNRAVTERVERYGMQVVPGDLVRARQNGDRSSGSGSDSEPPVVIITECNLTDYSIEDVVLPLPGYNSVYPTNEVGRLYQAILEADKIVFRKDALPETTAKGSYRSLKTSVTNVKSEILNRDDSGLDLRIRFDLPAGSFATMVLRELMRTTVSRS